VTSLQDPLFTCARRRSLAGTLLPGNWQSREHSGTRHARIERCRLDWRACQAPCGDLRGKPGAELPSVRRCVPASPSAQTRTFGASRPVPMPGSHDTTPRTDGQTRGAIPYTPDTRKDLSTSGRRRKALQTVSTAGAPRAGPAAREVPRTRFCELRVGSGSHAPAGIARGDGLSGVAHCGG
jgi:hypothetical protein